LGAATLAWWAVVGGVAALAWGLQTALLGLPHWAAVPLLALALKPSFAWRMLRDEVAAVDAAFMAGGLPAAQQRLRNLCSRDVERLDAREVRETAIETLAENLNDSVVAPLFWFCVAGLPGAWAWRAVNTLDAMWGYRGRWEWAGKWSARADDVLGWLPARLTALMLWRPSLGFAPLAHEAARTPSPNGGWPMGAMALRLGRRRARGRAAVAPGGACMDLLRSEPALRRVHGGPDRHGPAPWDFSTCANAVGPCPAAVAALQRVDPTRY
ncbi:CobD/CbiB family cobalamin biosynthesis protein, partial [Rubrivivax gelatinosus]|uniref:CobD/CbiB family cobalamin biosynthesis protein n=1 Tax=Rubrivivax gelatinosus TaxID=28068 RepID=UPI000C1F9711